MAFPTELEAYEAATKLAKELGGQWKPDVWENSVGWHAAARLNGEADFTCNVYISHYPQQKRTYSCCVNVPGGGSYGESRRDPRKAVAAVVKRMKKDAQALLALAAKMEGSADAISMHD